MATQTISIISKMQQRIIFLWLLLLLEPLFKYLFYKKRILTQMKKTSFLRILIFLPAFLLHAGQNDFNGSWDLAPQKSTVISFYATLSLEFQVSANRVTLIQKWGTRTRDRFQD